MKTIQRILDANLDRSREGLRIIEEWCRFGLNNSDLAQKCKDLRQELASWHSRELRLARDTVGDPGTELSHPQEEKRGHLSQVLQANLCRVQESLRVLEEYGKLYQSGMGEAFKQMRYRVYILESDLLTTQCRQQLQSYSLYLVTSPSPNLLSIVESALKGGLKLVQYRDKNTNDSDRLSLGKQLCQLCHQYEALFIMNDRADLAAAVGADGLHLGQQDMPIQLAREIVGSDCLIGRSTTNPEEMQKAIAEGADYIGVGPVYATPTKPGKKAAGLDYVQYAAENATVPWFAIGGIDLENVSAIMQAGGRQVAIVRAIMQADDPKAMTQSLLSKLTQS